MDATARPALYDEIGTNYARVRRADARIAARIHHALGDARSVINVGAGTGSYEPSDRAVVAVDPSLEMIEQRPPEAAPCVVARAEALPFGDAAFDAGLAVLTLHHWTDPFAGLREMKRVCRKRVVLFTWDPSFTGKFWMTARYLPEAHEFDRRFLPIEALAAVFQPFQVETVPLAQDCTDGFFGAYWRRPWAYLDPQVQAGISLLRQLEARTVEKALSKLKDDLESGAWEELIGRHLPNDALDLGYRIVIADLG